MDAYIAVLRSYSVFSGCISVIYLETILSRVGVEICNQFVEYDKGRLAFLRLELSIRYQGHKLSIEYILFDLNK